MDFDGHSEKFTEVFWGRRFLIFLDFEPVECARKFFSSIVTPPLILIANPDYLAGISTLFHLFK
jgi:hypothetical protein